MVTISNCMAGTVYRSRTQPRFTSRNPSGSATSMRLPSMSIRTQNSAASGTHTSPPLVSAASNGAPPRSRRGRRILARVTPVKVSAGTLFEDFECEALSNFHSCRAEDGAHGFRRASLPANHLAEILGMYAQLKNGHLLAFDRTHLNFFRMIHSR